MRTQEEIKARMETDDIKKALFGFAHGVLLEYLTYENAKEHLVEGTTEEQWKEATKDIVATDEGIKNEALVYLVFAWDKASNHRGLSAGRSVQKMTEYMWLLGKDDVLEKVKTEAVGYKQYGAPILKLFSEALGAPIPDSKDMVNMMAGKPCRPDCYKGCGIG